MACHNRGTWSADLGTIRHWALDGCLTTREQTDRTGPRERTFPCEEYDGMEWEWVDEHDGCKGTRACRDASEMRVPWIKHGGSGLRRREGGGEGRRRGGKRRGRSRRGGR